MQFKSLKIGYVALIFFLLLTGLFSTAHASAITTPSSCPATLPPGTVNVPYSFTFYGDGTASNAWDIPSGTSNLPSTLTLTSQTKTQAILSGTPLTNGNYTFIVTYKNSPSCTCYLTVNPTAKVCTTSGNGVIDFGTLDAITNSGGVAASESLVTTKPIIYCTAGSTYNVNAAGANGGTDMGIGYRLKHGTSDYIAYNISYTTPISGAGDTVSIGGSGTGKLALTPSISAGAFNSAPAGTYSDTITLTITY